jgi:hypothetical protein
MMTDIFIRVMLVSITVGTIGMLFLVVGTLLYLYVNEWWFSRLNARMFDEEVIRLNKDTDEDGEWL